MTDFKNILIKTRDIDADIGPLIHPNLFDSIYMNYIEKKYEIWLQ
jgi:hypothetical protein